MNKEGEIIIIEDDEDDQFLLEEVFAALGYANKRVYFPDGQAALEYLNSDSAAPFIILSDINMPRLNGLELRNKLQTVYRPKKSLQFRLIILIKSYATF